MLIKSVLSALILTRQDYQQLGLGTQPACQHLNGACCLGNPTGHLCVKLDAAAKGQVQPDRTVSIASVQMR